MNLAFAYELMSHFLQRLAQFRGRNAHELREYNTFVVISRVNFGEIETVSNHISSIGNLLRMLIFSLNYLTNYLNYSYGFAHNLDE